MSSNSGDPAARRALEGHLGSLLGFDDVSDVFDHLLTIDTSEDLLEYLSQLLGDDGEGVNNYVKDVGRFQRGERLEHVVVDTSSDANGQQTGSEVGRESAKAQQIEGGRNGASSWLQQWEREEQGRKEKQADVDKQMEALEAEKKAQEEKAQRQRSLGLDAAPAKKNPRKAVANKAAKSKTAQAQKQKVDKGKQKSEANAAGETKGKNVSMEAVGEEADRAEKPSPIQRGKATVVCGCFGTLHKPLTNCLHCGRIACRQEGYGYCPFCGYLIEKVTVKAGEDGKFDKALLHKERLLRFDREFAKRTIVLDDQADYFSNTTSTWLDEEERAEAEERDEVRRKELHERKKQTLNIAL